MKPLKFTLLIVIFSAAISCIALEDEFSPTISNDFVSDETYYYNDSLHVNVTFRDNILIEESNIRLQLIESSSFERDTVLFSFDTAFSNLNARLFKFDSSFVIPLYAKTGKYLLETSNIDTGENLVKDTTNFYVGSDTIPPIINEFSLINENTQEDHFCRGDHIFINTFVTDNLALDRFIITIDEELQGDFNLEETSSINISNVIQNKIFIPSQISNGTHQFQLSVIDLFGNKTDVIKTFIVLCDNEPAELISFEEESGKELSSDHIVQLFPGEEFNLSSLIFEDEGGLDSARLEIIHYGSVSTDNESPQVTVETPITIALERVTKIDLSTVFEENFSFGFDKFDTKKGEVITVNIKVKDLNQSWDNASVFTFSLIAKEDLPPEIVIDNLLINGMKTDVPLNEEYDLTGLLETNDQLQIGLEGIVNEQIGLTSIKYTFNSGHRSVQSFGRIINLTEEALVYPVQIQDIISTTFPIDNNEHFEGKINYYLEVIVNDFQEQSDTVNFIFSADY